jgi:hypothetical protein
LGAALILVQVFKLLLQMIDNANDTKTAHESGFVGSSVF